MEEVPMRTVVAKDDEKGQSKPGGIASDQWWVGQCPEDRRRDAVRAKGAINA